MGIRLVAAVAVALAATPASAKKKAAAAAPKQASAQTARAIGDLAGKFKWGMSHEQAMKVIADDIGAKFDERIKKETIPAKQQVVLKDRDDAIQKIKEGYVKFDGQKTGWDVSIADREFVHKNDESMLVIMEKDQRRFLFFWNDKLWKQFIAFNAENPVFANKTFDDFAELIQKRYGPSSMTFRKQRASDDQTLDHLEWPPSGDYILWAIDLTTFYGNFCLSLMQKSVLGPIEKARAEKNPAQRRGNALVDQVTRGDGAQGDANADIVDEITGRQGPRTNQGGPVDTSGGAKPDKGKKKAPPKEGDPLEGMQL